MASRILLCVSIAFLLPGTAPGQGQQKKTPVSELTIERVESFRGVITFPSGGPNDPKPKVFKFNEIADGTTLRFLLEGGPNDRVAKSFRVASEIDFLEFMKVNRRSQIATELAERREEKALGLLEALIEELRSEREQLAKDGTQSSQKRLEQVKAELAQAHLEAGALGQLVQARREVQRLEGDRTLPSFVPAELAVARGRLQGAQKRFAEVRR